MIKYLMNRLKEASTWQGIITILALLGIHLSPEQANAIATAGVAVLAAVSVFFPG